MQLKMDSVMAIMDTELVARGNKIKKNNNN